MRELKLFDDAVQRYFMPVAERLRLQTSRVRDGFYELASPFLVARIRLDTGHRRGLNVIAHKPSMREIDENEPWSQIGIANFAKAAGEECLEPDIENDGDFLERAAWLAKATDRLLTPYFLGLKRS